EARGLTPLMLAVATDRQNPEVVRMLLAKGADVNVKSLAGETALDWARKEGPASSVTALKQAGATESEVKVLPAAAYAPVDLRPAVERSIALLEKASIGLAANGGCASCHAQNITDIAISVARAKGLRVDESAALERQKLTKLFFLSPAMQLERMDVPGTPDLPLYGLAALAATG